MVYPEIGLWRDLREKIKRGDLLELQRWFLSGLFVFFWVGWRCFSGGRRVFNLTEVCFVIFSSKRDVVFLFWLGICYAVIVGVVLKY